MAKETERARKQRERAKKQREARIREREKKLGEIERIKVSNERALRQQTLNELFNSEEAVKMAIEAPLNRLNSEDRAFVDEYVENWKTPQQEQEEKWTQEAVDKESLYEVGRNDYIGRSTKRKYKKLFKKLFKEDSKKRNESDNGEDGEDEEDEESGISGKKVLRTLKLVVASLVLISDITRRILTATLAKATEDRNNLVRANALGMSYFDYRNLGYLDIGMGLKKGTHAGAIQDIQSKFGDLTHLDENSLGILARVIGSDISDLVKTGMGYSDPEKLSNMILDDFFNRFKRGENSIGQIVGQQQALRELTTVLNEISPNLADMFAVMGSDYLQGLYAGKFDDVEGYRSIFKIYNGGLTKADLENSAEIGQLINQTKEHIATIKDDILVKFAESIKGLIVKVDNVEFGKGKNEKLEDRAENILKNREDAKKAKVGMDVANSAVEKILYNKGLHFEDFGVTNASQLYDLMKISQYDDVADSKIEPIKKFLRTEAGKDFMSYLLTSKYYSNVYATTSKRANTKTGKVEHDPTLLNNADVQIGVEALDLPWLRTWSSSDVLSLYENTYGVSLDNFDLMSFNDNEKKQLFGAIMDVERAGGNYKNLKYIYKQKNPYDSMNESIKNGTISKETISKALENLFFYYGYRNWSDETGRPLIDALDETKVQSEGSEAYIVSYLVDSVIKNIPKNGSVTGTKVNKDYSENKLHITIDMKDAKGNVTTANAVIDLNNSSDINKQIQWSTNN